MSSSQKMRELRKYRKENGLCIKCGESNDRLPKIYCTECSIEVNEYEALQREKRKNSNQCVDCGKSLIIKGYRCKTCSEKHRKRLRESKEKNKVKRVSDIK